MFYVPGKNRVLYRMTLLRNSILSYSFNCKEIQLNHRYCTISLKGDSPKAFSASYTDVQNTQNLNKHKVAVVIGFSGKEYDSFGHHPNKCTIESQLLDALYQAGCVSKYNYSSLNKIQWRPSSRIGKKAHAKHLLISAKLLIDPSAVDSTSGKINGLAQHINTYLPPNIRIFQCTKVSKSFDAKTACHVREYCYLLPVDFLMQTNEEMGSNPSSIIDKDVITLIHKFKNFLKEFEGRKSYLNFIKKRLKTDIFVSNKKRLQQNMNQEEYMLHHKTQDSKFYRVIYRCDCTNPFSLYGMDVIKVTITGQSFLPNQIHHMLASALAATCGTISKTELLVALNTPVPISMPVLPPIGLIASNCYTYRKQATPNKNVSLDRQFLNKEEKQLQEAFQTKVIYKDIIATWKACLINKEKYPNLFYEWNRKYFEKRQCVDESVYKQILHTWNDIITLKEKKFHKRRKDWIKDEEVISHQSILPKGLATKICVEFNILPGEKLSRITRAIAKKLIDQTLPYDSSLNDILMYIKDIGIDKIIIEEKNAYQIFQSNE